MSELHSSHRNTKTKLGYPALLFFFTLVVFWKLIFTAEYSALTYPDSSFQTYPWFQYIAGVLHRGSFPFWDPYDGGGRPFIGETQTAAFYPLNLLMGYSPLNAQGLLPVSLIEGFIILHVFLAALFMYLLARHLGLSPFSAFVSGITFAYSGSVASRAFAQVNLFYASIWIPTVFLFYSKSLRSHSWNRRLLYSNLAGLSLALSLLAGHHQPFFNCIIALACVAIALSLPGSRRMLDPNVPPISHWFPSGLMFLVLVFAVGYCALQLLPSLEYSHLAYRWTGTPRPALVTSRVPYSIAGSQYVMPPEGLLLVIFPYITAVENRPYFGILPLFFCLVSLAQSKKSGLVQLAWLIAVLFILLAMGQYFPLHGLLYALLPGFDKGREASRSLLFAHGAISLLVGFGCQAYLRPIPKRERRIALKFLQIFVGLSSFLILVVFLGYFYRTQVLYQATNYGPLFMSCLFLFMTSAIAICRYYSLSSSRALKVAVALLLLFDCHYAINNYLQLKQRFDGKTNYEPKQYYSNDDLVRFLKAKQEDFRVQFRDSYPWNIGEVYKLETINEHGATRLKRFHDFTSAEATAGGRISDLLNVKYVVSNQNLNLPKVFATDRAKVYENVDCLPRAWLVSHLTPKPDVDSIRARLLEPDFDPREEALTEGRVDLSKESGNASQLIGHVPSNSSRDGLATSPPRYQAVSPNRFRVQVTTQEACYLVISQTWYPGWRAAVNGQPQQVVALNGILMGVGIGSGTSNVEFVYRPTHFGWALGLTTFSLLVLAVLSFRRYRHLGEN